MNILRISTTEGLNNPNKYIKRDPGSHYGYADLPPKRKLGAQNNADGTHLRKRAGYLQPSADVRILRKQCSSTAFYFKEI